MTTASRPHRTFIALGASLMTLGACASYAPTAISSDYLEGTGLSRNAVSAVPSTKFLEVAIDPAAGELSSADRARIKQFVGAYAQTGHGPLVLSLPAASANPQLAVTAVAEARSIAWAHGVEYDEIEGSAHGAGEAVAQPMIIAFQAYDAVAPDCASKASLDFADTTSNNHLPTLGCSVRTNLAAMIADPADLLGARPLGQGDNARREVILEKFRLGEPTGATRSTEESGAISQAVD